MTAEEILVRLKAAIDPDQTLALTPAVLTSPELDALLDAFFDGALLVRQARGELIDHERAVALTGTATYGSTTCDVDARFRPAEDALEISLSLQPDARPWQLSDLFPSAVGPEVADLRFSDGGIQVTCGPQAPTMHVAARLDAASSPQPLPALFPEAAVEIGGPVTDPNLGLMVLRTVPAPFSIAGVALVGVSLLVSIVNLAPAAATPVALASIGLEATLELSETVRGSTVVQMASGSTAIQMRTTFVGVTLDGLNDLSDLLFGANPVEALPGPLAEAVRRQLRALELRSLDLQVDLVSGSISSVRLGASVHLGNFAPLGALSSIVVNRLDLDWFITLASPPAEAAARTTTTFEAIAAVDLTPQPGTDGSKLETPATLCFQTQPDGAYRIIVATNQEVKPTVAELVHACFPGIDLPGEQVVEELTLVIEPPLQRLSFDLSLQSDWEIVTQPSLSLTEVVLGVRRDAFATPTTSGSASAVFLLDLRSDPADTDPPPPLEFILAAASPSDGSGWRFSGQTSPGQRLSVPALASALADRFGTTLSVPRSIEDLEIHDVSVNLDTGLQRYRFGCGAGLTIDGTPADLVVGIDLETGLSGEMEGRFSASLRIGGLMFDVLVDHRSASTDLVAVFAPTPAYPATTNLRDVIAKVSPAAARAIPADLNLSLGAVKFVLVRGAGSTEFVLGLDLSASFGLASLPVVGHLLPAETITIDEFQLLFSVGKLTAAQAESVNRILPSSAIPLPAQGLAPGVSATTIVKVGSVGRPIELGLPPAAAPPTPMPPPSAGAWSNQPWAWALEDGRPLGAEILDPADPSSNAAPSAPGSTKWFDVQRTAGPFTLGRIGLSYRDNTLYFLLDASLSFAGLDLGFTGLGLGSPLTAWEPRGHLSGISVAFKQGNLTLEGGLLANPSESDDSVTEEYLGTITIGLGAAQVSGVAAFARVDGHPSFFAFGQVDAKLGGPPAFFITGAMGGFGYEWSLRMPAPQEVSTFPLVAGLTDPAVFGKGKPTPDRVLTVLRGGNKPWVKPELGERWIAGGISFRSFELISGRLLAVVAFGKEEEIALLGVASMTLPQGAASDRAYAFVELQLQVVLRPKEGVFAAMASLTPSSFLLTRDCHLTGGFALGFWFDGSPHAGDFALTIGGYHPAFVPPSWYPVVPRVGLNWKVSSQVVIKGGAYFALTPTAVMAGGNLEILFQAGGLKAWLTAVTNLLVRWRPFSFDVEIGVSVGVSYQLKLGFTTVTLTAELSANLHLWGPPTGGVAHVNWWIISFTIPFGAPAGSLVDPVLDWAEFKTLLPSVSAGTPAIPGPISDLAGLQAPGQRPLAVVGLAIERGLAKTSDDGAWTVRADVVRLRATSAAPITHLTVGALVELPDGVADTVDVRPMAIAGATSSYTLEVRALDGGPQPDLQTWPAPDLITTALPTSLWGAPLPARQPPPATAQLTGDLLTGFVFSPPPAREGPTTEPINASVLVDARVAYNQPLDPATQADSLRQPEVDAQTVHLIAEHLASERTIAVQDALLAALRAAGAAPPPCGPLVRMAATAGELFEEAPLRAATPHGETA